MGKASKNIPRLFLIIFCVLFLIDLVPFIVGIFIAVRSSALSAASDVPYTSDMSYVSTVPDTSVTQPVINDTGSGNKGYDMTYGAGDWYQQEEFDDKLLASDYYIDGYNVDIKVNENNVLEVTETVNAYFNVSKHGIFRRIPLKNTVQRLDGTTSTNRARISGLDVNEQYSTSRENGYSVIKIGDPDVTLTGPKTYVIKYKYDLGKDTGDGYDELYFNIIGDQWDTYIRNVSFSIQMPKEFDISKLGFSRGYKGSTESSGITYEYLGEGQPGIIIGKYAGTLEPYSGLTVRLELPEGYFVNAGAGNSMMTIIAIAIPIIFLVISFVLWWIFGKDEKTVEPVEFYPPEGFNSAEIGYIYKGRANDEDVVSLMIYLANKGYLKIEEITEKVLFGTHTTFKITQLVKSYAGNNAIERKFFDGLFACGHTNSKTGMKEVTASDLHDRFYKVTNEIKSMLNQKANKNKFFESASSSKRIFVMIMILLTYLIITAKPVLDYEPEMLIFALLFPGIGATVVGVMLAQKPNVFTMVFALIWGAGFAGIPWLVMVLPAIMQDAVYVQSYISGIICIVGMVICYVFMPKRTAYGNKLYGRVKGFKNFLETAEKDKLEALVEETPSYFYDILPYTYVLGISDKWIKQFESINLQSPDWYDGGSAFSTAAFGSFMASTMSSASSAMTSSPSSSSGGSSGGGSSGGGSGGGGGGSW
ncbi:MAG: DUF2207 domain-containing protein [Bacteroides sp.]